MKIPVDKVIGYDKNRYVFTKAVMEAIDKVDSIPGYPEADHSWKIVSNCLNLTLNEKLNFAQIDEEEANIDESSEEMDDVVEATEGVSEKIEEDNMDENVIEEGDVEESSEQSE